MGQIQVGTALVQAGKLGALLFQFPPWWGIRRDSKDYLREVAARCKPDNCYTDYDQRNATTLIDLLEG